MTRQELISELEDILEADIGTLKEEDALEDLEMWDSLAVVSYIAIVDGELELTLEPQKISNAKTVAELLELAAEKLEN